MFQSQRLGSERNIIDHLWLVPLAPLLNGASLQRHPLPALRIIGYLIRAPCSHESPVLLLYTGTRCTQDRFFMSPRRHRTCTLCTVELTGMGPIWPARSWLSHDICCLANPHINRLEHGPCNAMIRQFLMFFYCWFICLLHPGTSCVFQLTFVGTREELSAVAASACDTSFSKSRLPHTLVSVVPHSIRLQLRPVLLHGVWQWVPNAGSSQSVPSRPN